MGNDCEQVVRSDSVLSRPSIAKIQCYSDLRYQPPQKGGTANAVPLESRSSSFSAAPFLAFLRFPSAVRLPLLPGLPPGLRPAPGQRAVQG